MSDFKGIREGKCAGIVGNWTGVDSLAGERVTKQTE